MYHQIVEPRSRPLVVLRTSGCIENVGSYWERLLVLSRYLIVCSHRSIEPVCHPIVIVLIIIILFWICLNHCSYHIIWLTLLKSKKPNTQSHFADKTHTYIQRSITIHLHKPAGPSRVMSRLFAVSIIWERQASRTQGRQASTTQERLGKSWSWRPKSQVWQCPASCLSHHFTCGFLSRFLL